MLRWFERASLGLLLIIVVATFFYERCTPLAPLVVRVWGFIGRLFEGVWGGLEWPHAVLFIFAMLLVNFKEELRSFIQRVDEFGPSGIKARQFVPPVSAADASTISETSADTPHMAPADTPSTGADEEPAVVSNVGEDYGLPPIYFPQQMGAMKILIATELAAREDKLDYLVEHLAFSRVWSDYESTYSVAFGGQLSLLNLLNQEYGSGMPDQVLSELWVSYQSQHKPTFDAWNKEQYVWMLQSRGYIAFNQANRSYYLTIKGREFLGWISSVGKTLSKPW